MRSKRCLASNQASVPIPAAELSATKRGPHYQ